MLESITISLYLLQCRSQRSQGILNKKPLAGMPGALKTVPLITGTVYTQISQRGFG